MCVLVYMNINGEASIAEIMKPVGIVVYHRLNKRQRQREGEREIKRHTRYRFSGARNHSRRGVG